MNPITAAEQLKQLVESNDPYLLVSLQFLTIFRRLQSPQYAILNGLKVVDAESATTVEDEVSSAITLVSSAVIALISLVFLF